MVAADDDSELHGDNSFNDEGVDTALAITWIHSEMILVFQWLRSIGALSRAKCKALLRPKLATRNSTIRQAGRQAGRERVEER